jgi:hypothetical protein
MTLQPLPSVFPYTVYEENSVFFFISVPCYFLAPPLSYVYESTLHSPNSMRDRAYVHAAHTYTPCTRIGEILRSRGDWSTHTSQYMYKNIGGRGGEDCIARVSTISAKRLEELEGLIFVCSFLFLSIL